MGVLTLGLQDVLEVHQTGKQDSLQYLFSSIVTGLFLMIN